MTTPKKITAGDSAEWTLSLSDYPAGDGWALSYALVASGSQITFTGAASGDDHKITLAAATTSGWTAGKYRYQAYVTLGSDRETVETGEIEIRPNFATLGSGYDGRSQWQKILDSLMTAYESMQSGYGTQSVTMADGRSVTYRTTAELLPAISKARAEVAREQRAEKLAQGLGAGNNVKIRF